jgi:Ca-activated chloride channel family protein
MIMSTRSISALCLGLIVGLPGCSGNSPGSYGPKSALKPQAAPVVPAAGLHEAISNDADPHFGDGPWLAVKNQPLSTFSIDVDTASYSNVRRYLQQGQLPPLDAVRIEELINYFSYDDPQPEDGMPFSVNVEVASCPWNARHRLARIGLKGKSVSSRERPAGNLVFLLDVSGSMSHPKKLPLVKESLRLLVEQLEESDHIAIVVYAGAAGVVLPATSAANKDRILQAIDRLQPGGSTNGALGIRLAYDIARENRVPGGVNRVILCTDGDFNVGATSPPELQRLIEAQARTGVFLTVLGYGMGNFKDATMERLADCGNGNYGYVDNIAEARKLLVEQLSGTLLTIAKDVKIQVEFNPAQIDAYRLIGYDNRRLADRDFRDDNQDAGDIGAGHSVSALYELIPSGSLGGDDEPLRYQPGLRPIRLVPQTVVAPSATNELMLVKLRYKAPDSQTSRLLEFPVVDTGMLFGAASANLRFAAAVAQFGMLLTSSGLPEETTFEGVIETATAATENDPHGHRAEFLVLVKQARSVMRENRSLAGQ